MKLRWTPRPPLILVLLLAATLNSGGGSGGGNHVEAAATDSGWVPVVGPAHRGNPVESPQFGSRMKPRIPRQETVTTTTIRSTSVTPKLKPKPPKPTTPTRVRATRQGSTSTPEEDEEETKSLAQQVIDGKYALIQNEIFSSGVPQRPGILSYTVNHEVPHDTADNLGGLSPDEIWLSEGHVLVLAGGSLGAEGHWDPIDDYEAPHRPIKLPPNPSVPPPFPVQLKDGGPTGFVSSNRSSPFKYSPPAPGNFEPGNGIFPPLRPPQHPFPPRNGSYLPPPFYRQENLTQDDDDPSVFYPPPYDFSYQQDNTTQIPPGPLVPGIVLPPPPNFFAPLNKSAAPTIYVPDGLHNHLEPPPPPPFQEFDRLPPIPHQVQNIVTQAPAIENEIIVPDFPYKEPNVILRHHGSPVYITKNVTRVQVSPPEQLVVYELKETPQQLPRSRGRTIVSSTPSPTALYYTLPPEPPIQLTIYSATPAPPHRQHHTQTFFANAPNPKPFSTPKPKYYEQAFYEPPTSTPQPIYLYPDTTPSPPTTPAPTRKAKKPNRVVTTTEAPHFFPSSVEYEPINEPTTTTAAPAVYNGAPKGRYLPIGNIQSSYFFDIRPSPPPRYVPPRPSPRPDYYYDPPQRQPQPYFNPQPDPGYFYPSSPPQRRPSYQTPAPAYENVFYQSPQRRPSASNPEVNFFYPPPKRNQAVVSTTPNPIFNGLYTKNDEKFMDDITKGYFTQFGQRLTTPLPPLAPTESIPTPISLHDDTRVNFRRPLPPINPDSEFIDLRGRDPSVVSYQLPGQGQRGPSHYFFLTPRFVPSPQDTRVPRDSPRTNSARAPRASPTVTPAKKTVK